MKSLATVTIAACALFFTAHPVLAQNKDSDMLSVTGAWIRTTVPGAKVSGAYMRIQSTQPLKLIKADTPVAGMVELHNMTMKDGVMEMKAMASIDIPANQLVELKPGGMHVMLMQVMHPIKMGDKVPLTLTFEVAGHKPMVVKLEAIAQEQAVLR